MKRLPPDTRPSWRDPNMPVFRTEIMIDNWTGKVVEQRTIQLTPEQENLRAQAALVQYDPYNQYPSWHDDPTYNLRRKRCGRI